MKHARFGVKKFAVLAILFGLQGPHVTLAAPSNCAELVGADREFTGVDLSATLPDPVVEALNDVEIPRPGLFAPNEAGEFKFNNRSVDLVIGRAYGEPLKIGSLIDPAFRGTVVSSTDSKITAARSEKLHVELSKAKPVGDLMLFANSGLDRGMLAELKAEGVTLEAAADGYYKIDDNIFVTKFLDLLVKEASISDTQRKYVDVVLKGMIAASRESQGPEYQKKLNGIRMRWKSEGKGADYDVVHTDRPAASIATTLTLIGNGTEVFYENGNVLEVRSVPAGFISSVLGDASGHPAVKHRASTVQGKRIVFLMFWN
ncbi:MAG: hypothetical protein AAB250_06345 [Bdellovibrionota bacterium]